MKKKSEKDTKKDKRREKRRENLRYKMDIKCIDLTLKGLLPPTFTVSLHRALSLCSQIL